MSSVRPSMVTVAMPVLNEERQVGRQLAALAGQAYRGRWELLIADNGCSDRTIDVALGWRSRVPELRIVDATRRRGLGHARNVAARAAAGDFIAFCDADDVVAPGWLEALVAAADRGHIVGGALDLVALNDARVLARCGIDQAHGLPGGYGFLSYAPGGNCGVWTHVARELGWDERFSFGSSDIEFCWRAQLAGHELAFAPEAVVRRKLATSLPELARQYFRFGRSDPPLRRRFGPSGMPPLGRRGGLWPWRRLAAEMPALLRSEEVRGAWVRTVARRLGRVRGGAEVLRERGRPSSPTERPGDGGLHVLEAVLRWPPETFLQRKLAGLAARGIRITVASTVPRRRARVAVEGAELLHVPSWREPFACKLAGAVAGGLALLVEDPRRLARLLRAIRRPRPAGADPVPWTTTVDLLRRYLPLARAQPDLVHFEWETAAAHYLPLMDVWDCPVVMSCRGRAIHMYTHIPGNEGWVDRLPEAFERAAAVHCVSDAIRDEAMAHGLDPAKARVIHPAVDPTAFAPAPPQREDGALRVVSVGDLIWPKGYEYAVCAIDLAARRGVPVGLDLVGDVRLDLFGRPTERERILATIDDLELRDRVSLHGRLASRDVRALLQRADVLLHPSLVEGLPNAVLEAMACGLPVVATTCGGTPDAVRSGSEGFLVEPRDIGGMADALELLWREPERRAAMGRAARARVVADFDLADQVDAVVALYEQVTGRRLTGDGSGG